MARILDLFELLRPLKQGSIVSVSMETNETRLYIDTFGLLITYIWSNLQSSIFISIGFMAICTDIEVSSNFFVSISYLRNVEMFLPFSYFVRVVFLWYISLVKHCQWVKLCKKNWKERFLLQRKENLFKITPKYMKGVYLNIREFGVEIRLKILNCQKVTYKILI